MISFDDESCPAALQNQVNAITFSLQEFLENSLVGIYLYGSLACGDFVMKNSDIDLLVVVKDRLNPFKRLAIAQKMLLWNKTPAPVEISILAREHLSENPPMRCQFHFSSKWEKDYQQFIEKKEAFHWLLKQDFEDADIPAHVYLTRFKSVVLFGEKATDIFPKIDDETFMRSACADFKTFKWKPYDVEDTAYRVLTLCRLLAFREKGKVMSKNKAATYALTRLSLKKQVVVRRALDYKFNQLDVKKFPAAALEDFKNDVCSKLKGFL